ncbi:hypothetical protein EVAR_29841_1 [Eumeta japonica]|uniref:Uncharacterized protein n=1 Tax=Eumeta variegata TaxID=151549 RepID=A0A4C1VU53_EUMVA|nr:hypothetical protein EVAR_29841_1 [Eumeta japonica]
MAVFMAITINITEGHRSEHIAIILFYCQSSQRVVDAQYKFVYVDVGSYGKDSDSAILARCKLCNLIKNNNLNIPPDRPLPELPEPVLQIEQRIQRRASGTARCVSKTIATYVPESVVGSVESSNYRDSKKMGRDKRRYRQADRHESNPARIPASHRVYGTLKVHAASTIDSSIISLYTSTKKE